MTMDKGQLLKAAPAKPAIHHKPAAQ
jgi:hypothetical protein